MENYNSIFDMNQGEPSPLAGYVRLLFNVALIAISALASFSFFYYYSSGLLTAVLPPTLAGIGAGFIGVLLSEGAVLWWHFISVRDADTRAQMSLARVGYFFSLVLSVSVTAVYFLLSSSLIEPFLTPQFEDMVSLTALLIIVISVGVQFTLSREYSRQGSGTQRSEHEAVIRAESNRAKFVIQQQTNRANLERSVEGILREIPSASSNYGDQITREYLERVYTQEPGRASENGRESSFLAREG